MAKAGGTVSRAHIGEAERLMGRLGLVGAARQRAIAWFDAGKDPLFDFVPLARACRGIGEDREVQSALALESLCLMACIAGPPPPPLRRELERVAGLLGFPGDDVTAAIERVIDFRRRQVPRKLHNAYQVLGVEHWVDETELKLAYRRLMSRHHPDKLGTSAAAHASRAATQNSAAVRAAYELIRTTRSGSDA
jgi:DnaJ like chaperone protein